MPLLSGNRGRDAAHAFAARCGRLFRYLYSTAERKETLPRELAKRNHITEA
jgi:hypothetical protein